MKENNCKFKNNRIINVITADLAIHNAKTIINSRLKRLFIKHSIGKLVVAASSSALHHFILYHLVLFLKYMFKRSFSPSTLTSYDTYSPQYLLFKSKFG